MTTKIRTIDTYIERAKARMLKKYPNLEFEIWKRTEDEAFLFFHGPYDTDEYGYQMLKTAGGVMTDAVVDEGFLLYVMPRD
jgi:hypothetical protein